MPMLGAHPTVVTDEVAETILPSGSSLLASLHCVDHSFAMRCALRRRAAALAASANSWHAPTRRSEPDTTRVTRCAGVPS